MRNKKARDIMTADVLTVRADMTLQEVANFFVEQEISGAPVLDEDDKLVGMVSLKDIAQQASEFGEIADSQSNPFFDVREWGDKLDASELKKFHIEDTGVLVRDVMTPTVYKVTVETPIQDVARTMLGGRVHRLVVTQDERVAGIITTMDILRLLADFE